MLVKCATRKVLNDEVEFIEPVDEIKNNFEEDAKYQCRSDGRSRNELAALGE